MKSLAKIIVGALFVGCSLATVVGQQPMNNPGPVATETSKSERDAGNSKTELSIDEKLQQMQKTIELQQQQIKELRALVDGLAAREVKPAPNPLEPSPVNTIATSTTSQPAPTKPPEAKEVLNGFTIKGDLRFRFEPFRNQGFDALDDAPARNRARIRARLEIKTDCKDRKNCFDFGLKLATGNLTDNISTNQTLGDFFERKTFALERAFVSYRRRLFKDDDTTWNFEVVAGKFEPKFRRTQMVWDDDVNVEGVSESISLDRKDHLFSGLTFVGFQLPFDEVPNGSDGFLFGGQLQTDWKLSANHVADLNTAYYSWNFADRILVGLDDGRLSNSAALAGGQNGTLGTTNRVIIVKDPVTGKDRAIGFLANFHLFDVMGNYVWNVNDDHRVRFNFDYVRNLSQRINDEKNGYWASIEFHRTNCVWQKGKWQKDKACEENLDTEKDWMLGYTFTRIQQDAVLVPFNFSDILASNSRAHIATIAYVPRPHVVLQWTGLFSQRANKIVPSSPVNRWLNRMQFDVIYKFK